MIKEAVYLVHGLIFILVILIGIGPMFSIAAPDPDQTDGIWGGWVSMIVIFNILVLASAFVQIKIKKIWVFLLSTIGLIVLFLLTLQYIYPYVLNLF